MRVRIIPGLGAMPIAMSTETSSNTDPRPSRYVYRTTGVCPPEIHFQILDGCLSGIRFVGGGCPGNAQLVARLLEGKSAAEVARELRGLACRNGTSCPDQLAQAIQDVQEGRLTTAETFRVHSDPTPRSRVALVGDLSGAAGVIVKVIAHASSRGVEVVCCLGNLIAGTPGKKAVLAALRKGQVTAVLGEEDWCSIQAAGAEGKPGLKPKEQRQLIQLPQVLRFNLGDRKAVAFHGDYLQQLPGSSDYDPFALEINMVCGLARFMQDEAVFPALEAMTPQFHADIVLFSKPRSWGYWRVGGKEFIGVGPAWDGRQIAWGLLEAGADGPVFQTILEPFDP
jgi:uncharacterized protein (TIGR03905 family)